MKPLSLSQRLLFSIASGSAGMFNVFFNSALPLYLGRYQLPYVLIGFLAQERSFLGSLIEPLVGALSDRTRTRLGRRRPFFLVGAPLTALLLVVVSQEPPTVALVLILSFLPFFLGIANVPYRAMMADISPPERRGRLGGAMALLEMIGQIGLLGLLAALWATNERLVFYIIAGGLVAGFGITFLAVKEPPIPPGPPPSPLRMASPLVYLKRVLAFRQAAKYVASQLLFWLGIGGVTPFVTRYGVSELGLSEATTFLALLVLLVFTAIFAVPSGIVGDLLGKKRVLAGGLFLFAGAVLAGSQAKSAEHLIVALAVAGIANGVTTALGFAFLTELLPRERMGELTGLSSMTWSFAQPLGATLAGFLADQSGTLRTTFELTALMLFASFLVLLTVKPPAAVEKATDPSAN
ncbi:MAG: MFS transporter [Chloroflexi bacterium]|nr:MFS transporter [Chloroflexota bacterium]